MIKLIPAAAKTSNEEAKQVFRQFAWALSGALKTKKSTRSKPQNPARPRAASKPAAAAAKRASKRSSN